jgi:hypothetical protein
MCLPFVRHVDRLTSAVELGAKAREQCPIRRLLKPSRKVIVERNPFFENGDGEVKHLTV